MVFSKRDFGRILVRDKKTEQAEELPPVLFF
jgi:hypothetical protein